MQNYGEQLRIAENNITNNQLTKDTKELLNILYERIKIYELLEGHYSSEEGKYTSREIDTHSAIGTLIGKLTVFDNFNEEIYGNYNDLELEDIQLYERIFYFIKINCNGEILESIERSCEYMQEFADSFFTDEEFLMRIIDFVICGISALICFILIPYIYKTQQRIVEIIILFIKIDKAEIKKRISNYEVVAKQINTHFAQIKELFLRTDFAICKQSIEERNKEIERLKNDKHSLSPKDNTIETNGNDSNKLPDKTEENNEMKILATNQLLENNAKIAEIR